MRVSSVFVSLKNLTRLLEVTQFHTGFPPLSREARAGREGDNLLRSPRWFPVVFHFALRKGRRKTVMPFSRLCKRSFAPDGLTRSDANWAATGSSAT